MHVELSLLYKTFLIIEIRSKILKAKGGTVQVLNIIDILSMTKVIDNRKLWLLSFLPWLWNFYASLMHQNFGKSHTCDMTDHCIFVGAVIVILICVMTLKIKYH